MVYGIQIEMMKNGIKFSKKLFFGQLLDLLTITFKANRRIIDSQGRT